MSENNEETQQEASLELYRSQLSQVEQAIQAAGESSDLVQLRSDLQELITLTEEHLLGVKKARLLQSLEELDADETFSGQTEHLQISSVDDEYSAFQAALSEDGKNQSNKKSLPSSSSNSTAKSSRDINKYDSEEDSDGEESLQASADLSRLIGTKCRAHYSHDYGGLHYGNAMVWSVDPVSEIGGEESCKVRVIFINPTHPSMIPCKYFLDGNCRFADGDCRRSHGYPILASELKPFEEPEHSKICEGCRCLAKYTDDVWYPATVTDVCDDHLVNVRFDAQKDECTVQVEHIVPLDGTSDDEDSSDTGDEMGPSGLSKNSDVDESESDFPVFLWKPAQTTDKLGAWEVHTKGIGSKLMAKMGYVTGQGLGPLGDGRAEPVPILLLPQGKSLDKIMELKEMSGNADLFNAMKKLEKQQKVLEKKEAEKEMQRKMKQNWGVFGFINRRLGENEEQDKHHAGSSSKKIVQASEKDLTKRSDKEVNVQIFKTAEEIKKAERNLEHLKQQLARNEARDRKMAGNVRQKILEQEAYLNQLRTSSQTLETHKERRSAHKKLTVF